MEHAERDHGGLTDALLSSIVDAAPDGIVLVDDAGVIEFANRTAARLFGYAADELVGEKVEILLPESRRAGHVSDREGYTAHPRTRAMGSGLDLHGQRRNGAQFPVEIGLSPVQADGRTHVIAVVRDVAERRAATDELARAHQQLALVDDRERIARDLHDTVIQRLFAVGLSLQASLAGGSGPRTTERVEAAIDEIDATKREIRTSIFSLHARRMPTAGLRDDVLAIAREAGRALGFEPRVVFDGAVDAATSTVVREHVVPALREALSNVVQHAAATHVRVSLVVEGDEIVLQVTDDGVGVSKGAHGGRGLGNMIERAEELGGRCDLRRADPVGTLLEWRVPADPPS